MLRALCVTLCALAPVGVLAGCGGGSSTTNKHTTTPTTTTSAAALAAGVAKAIKACKKEVTTSAYISAAEKSAGVGDCEGVKTGDVAKIAALRNILKNACEKKVIEKVPATLQAASTNACKKV